MTEPVFITLERPHGYAGPIFATVSTFPACGQIRRQRLSEAEYEHFRKSLDMTGLWAAELANDHYNLIRPITPREAVAMGDDGAPF